MRVIWDARAVDGLERLRGYIAADDPAEAERVFSDLLAAVEHIANTPSIGKAGRVTGTRELVVPKTGCLIAYAVTTGELSILAVQRSSRSWPDRF